MRTTGTEFETSVSPAFNGTTGTALTGVAELLSNTGLAASTCVSNRGPATCLASNSNSARTRPDLTPLSTCAPSRSCTPIPRVAQISSKLINTSPVISPSSSYISGGGSIRIQATTAAT
ncbi:hypothetical protein PSSY5922_27760 [Pseudomonas synxantha]